MATTAVEEFIDRGVSGEALPCGCVVLDEVRDVPGLDVGDVVRESGCLLRHRDGEPIAARVSPTLIQYAAMVGDGAWDGPVSAWVVEEATANVEPEDVITVWHGAPLPMERETGLSPQAIVVRHPDGNHYLTMVGEFDVPVEVMGAAMSLVRSSFRLA